MLIGAARVTEPIHIHIIRAHIWREGLAIAAAGMLVGLAASYVLARSISTFLFGITAHDGITFVIVPLVLLAISVIACAVPARRAAKMDPHVAAHLEVVSAGEMGIRRGALDQRAGAPKIASRWVASGKP